MIHQHLLKRTVIPVLPSWNTRASQQQAQEELQRLKTRLLEPILENTRDPDLCQRIRLAANEALVAAWNRPHPFLLFPWLLEQKVREVKEWCRHQQRILSATRQSRNLHFLNIFPL